jgi:hypothetical protein
MERSGEAEFLATQDRLRRGDDLGANSRPHFDPKQAREVKAAEMRGIALDVFRQALEYHGFVFEQRARMVTTGSEPGHVTTEGMWVHYQLRFAYHPSDLPRLFRGPEDFDKFIREQKAMRKLSGQGLKMRDVQPWRRLR